MTNSKTEPIQGSTAVVPFLKAINGDAWFWIEIFYLDSDMEASQKSYHLQSQQKFSTKQKVNTWFPNGTKMVSFLNNLDFLCRTVYLLLECWLCKKIVREALNWVFSKIIFIIVIMCKDLIS